MAQLEEPTPSVEPVKPKKPLPTNEEPVKIPVSCYLSEERIREIAREECKLCFRAWVASRPKMMVIKKSD